MKKIRVLLADDHAIMRIGLSSLLSREKDIDVVGEASDGEQAVALAKELKPDVVVMDLMMPKLNGAEATHLITAGDDSSDETVSHPRVLIFTSYGQAIDLAHAVLNGASGVLLKNAPTKELALSIRKVAAGEQVLSKVVMGMVRETSAASELTDRQLQIRALAVRGFTNQDIADQMKVSLITVKKQFSDIFIRLNVSNRAEAIATALNKHLLKT